MMVLIALTKLPKEVTLFVLHSPIVCLPRLMDRAELRLTDSQLAVKCRQLYIRISVGVDTKAARKSNTILSKYCLVICYLPSSWVCVRACECVWVCVCVHVFVCVCALRCGKLIHSSTDGELNKTFSEKK